MVQELRGLGYLELLVAKLLRGHHLYSKSPSPEQMAQLKAHTTMRGVKLQRKVSVVSGLPWTLPELLA